MASYFYQKESIMEMRMLQSGGFIQKNWENMNEAVYKEDFLFEKKLENRRLLFDVLRVVLNTMNCFKFRKN